MEGGGKRRARETEVSRTAMYCHPSTRWAVTLGVHYDMLQGKPRFGATDVVSMIMQKPFWPTWTDRTDTPGKSSIVPLHCDLSLQLVTALLEETGLGMAGGVVWEPLSLRKQPPNGKG